MLVLKDNKLSVHFGKYKTKSILFSKAKGFYISLHKATKKLIYPLKMN